MLSIVLMYLALQLAEAKIRELGSEKFLLSNFYNVLKFPAKFPCETDGRKAREISKRCRNFSKGSFSYFYFPLEIRQYKNGLASVKSMLVLKLQRFFPYHM